MKPGVVFDRRFADHSMGPYHVESPERILVLNRMLEEEAAGGFLSALDAVLEGRARNAIALVRPPGHHAEASQAMGFCFFNNVAVGAEYLVRRHGLRRVLIVDWDLHHGNGTQHAFYSRRDVLYFSTHQVPLYPGTGAARETGDGPGKGYNLNVPLSAGKGDEDFLHIYRRILSPIAAQFKPEFVLVSAGFDIGRGDPLGGMLVDREGFGLLADSLLAIAGQFCPGRVALVLEGGYDLPTLRDGVRECLERLSRKVPAPLPDPAVSTVTARELEPCFQTFRDFWEF
ncbi:MAG: histone deacetylase [Candidatus Aminicenantales bacterium]